VRIAQVEGLPPKPDDLRALLLRYLFATGVYDVGQTEPPLPTTETTVAQCDGCSLP